MSVDKLFTPVTVGKVTVPHRIVLAPLTRFRATEDQVPKGFVEEYYAQRATCHGLLITEATSIHPNAAPFEGSPGIYTQKQINAWRHIAERVHETGGKIFMQLWHVGRAAHSSLLNGEAPVSSSAVKMTEPVRGKYADLLGRRDPDTPRALEGHEIQEIIEQFAMAAENAVVKAGFDGVEIHAANGYLIDQFLRDGVNHRTDTYGGSIENRCRFPIQILTSVAEKIGFNKIGIRFNPFGNFNSMSDSDPMAVFGYLFRTLSTTMPDLAYVHLTEYSPTAASDLLTFDDRIDELRKAWNGIFILNLNRVSRSKAIRIVDEDRADLVALGRDFLANPDLPLRLSQNLPLNPQDPSTFYTHDEAGYTDYPFYKNRPENDENQKTSYWDIFTNCASVIN